MTADTFKTFLGGDVSCHWKADHKSRNCRFFRKQSFIKLFRTREAHVGVTLQLPIDGASKKVRRDAAVGVAPVHKMP